MCDIVVQLEVDHEGSLQISVLKVKVADFSPVSCKLLYQITTNHTVGREDVDEGIHFLAVLLTGALVQYLSRLLGRVDSHDHSESVTEGLALVEVEKDILVDSLGIDPVASLGEEHSQLDDVTRFETLLVQEIAHAFVLISREGEGLADPSRLLDLQGEWDVLSGLDVDSDQRVFLECEARR